MATGTFAAACAASTWATVPVSPTNLRGRSGSKLRSQAASTGPVSRAGSVVTNTTRTWLRSGSGVPRSAAAVSAIVVGQTSGQCV